MKKILVTILICSGALLYSQQEGMKLPPVDKIDFSKESERVNIINIKVFPKQILSWNVKYLNIACEEDFTHIPEEIKKLKNLETFSMSGGTGVAVFPNGFAELQNLKEITIYSNYIKKFPSPFLKLKNLEKLSLLCPYLESYPEDLGNLGNLKSLNLFNREYKMAFVNGKEFYFQPLSLPKSIKNLKKLENFFATKNMLKSIPEEIGGMESLKILNLGENYLENLPAGFSKLKNLISIDISKNNFKIFPSALYGVENLERIDYNENVIESFPPGIEKMSKLKYFFATKSKITSKALSELYNIPNLESVDLSDCQIESLPPGIDKLKHLKSLSFWGNKISPEELAKLKRTIPNVRITTVNPYK
ncbi:leucine-rich repeat domain-containing protein [Chryseobacterium sp.]|uniref:leucine-rich repeat domain-containing protein n=1 Tax=Chryseobacterium sp. TaxID=1871047 RepID=UPI002633DCD5|nr:leucine-rich repeat domain-containing protein [Chryseobacterium sp.]